MKKSTIKERSSYRNMMSRCNNPKATGYNFYGGRGIKVCERWQQSFEAFLEDMGPRPEGHSIDRVDPDGDYEPSNCRWADWKTQGNNKTDNHSITHNGETKTLQEWADEFGMKSNSLLYRLKRGWSLEEALGLTDRRKPHLSRLSKEDWGNVQALRDEGYTTLKLAELFKIDPSQISRKTINRNI